MCTNWRRESCSLGRWGSSLIPRQLEFQTRVWGREVHCSRLIVCVWICSHRFHSILGDDILSVSLPLSQPCCTVFSNDGYWYRAEITGLPAPDIAEVMYMDYGNSCQVPRGSLRRPKPHYLALPAQAVKSRLANVKPAGSVSWSYWYGLGLLSSMVLDSLLVWSWASC